VALDVSDLGSYGQPIEDEIAKPVHVGQSNVDEEIVSPRDMEDLDHLREPEGVFPERVDVCARVRTNANCDDRFQRSTERRMVDFGMEASDDAACAQGAHALEAARGSEPHELGEVLVRDPSILLESCYERAIRSVETLSRHRFRILHGMT